MKIGFFLENDNYRDIDFSKPENGNPGIRGTQYMMWIIAYKLSQNFAEVYMFAPYISTMPDSLTAISCQDEAEALYRAKDLGIDIMILRSKEENVKLFSTINEVNIDCVMWSHNFENAPLADAMAHCPRVKRNVCVGRQQYERLRDHPVFEKSTYIFNGLDFSSIHIHASQGSKTSKIVTYIGALNELKGFHRLAKAWPKIKKAVPDAELYVLGSGNMGSKTQLGCYGLAAKKYEKKFMKYLIGKDGAVSPEVHFMGNVGGSEKERFIRQTNVGVANPSGVGETFCIVAIEFETFGIPVVAKNGFGLLDTVRNGVDGILVNNDRELSKAIVSLLNDSDKCAELGANGAVNVRKVFSIDNISKQWEILLTDVYNHVPQTPDYRCSHMFNQKKWLREWNRQFQKTDIGKNSPSILKYEMIPQYIIRFLIKLRRKLLCRK